MDQLADFLTVITSLIAIWEVFLKKLTGSIRERITKTLFNATDKALSIVG